MFESPEISKMNINNPERKSMSISPEKLSSRHEIEKEKEKKEHEKRITLALKGIDKFALLNNQEARRLAEEETKRTLTPAEKKNLLFYRRMEAERLAPKTYTLLSKSENKELGDLWIKDIFEELNDLEKEQYFRLRKKYYDENLSLIKRPSIRRWSGLR